MNETNFTHFDQSGNAIMVDVSHKAETERIAVASGCIYMRPELLTLIRNGETKKGDVLSVARIAGIMGAKKTSELIPLCHPLMLTKITIDFEFNTVDCCIKSICTAKLSGKTGVEMEALTGVSISLLTIYDMCKAVEKDMRIADIHLEEKIGGKSGHYKGGA